MSKRARNTNSNSNKYSRTSKSCDYNSLVDGSLFRSLKRTTGPTRNIHQIIVKNNTFETQQIISGPRTHASDAFLVGIVDYTGSGQHGNHAVSALLINGKLYAFNAHGHQSQSMEWLKHYLVMHGFTVNNFIQYSGPNLQELDFTTGVCTAFSSRFLKLHPNAGMNQESFNEYVASNLSKYSISELERYLKNISSVRNIGVRRNNNARPMNVNDNVSQMNINRPKRTRHTNVRNLTSRLSALRIQ